MEIYNYFCSKLYINGLYFVGQILLAPQICPTTHKNRLILAVKNKNGNINIYT